MPLLYCWLKTIVVSIVRKYPKTNVNVYKSCHQTNLDLGCLRLEFSKSDCLVCQLSLLLRSQRVSQFYDFKWGGLDNSCSISKLSRLSVRATSAVVCVPLFCFGFFFKRKFNSMHESMGTMFFMHLFCLSWLGTTLLLSFLRAETWACLEIRMLRLGPMKFTLAL